MLPDGKVRSPSGADRNEPDAPRQLRLGAIDGVGHFCRAAEITVVELERMGQQTQVQLDEAIKQQIDDYPERYVPPTSSATCASKASRRSTAMPNTD